MIADESQWRLIAGPLTYEARIYVLEALQSTLISVFHDNPESGHFGPRKSAEQISTDIQWPEMEATIQKYVAGCELYQTTKAPYNT
jgi:hypothetical protein